MRGAGCGSSSTRPHLPRLLKMAGAPSHAAASARAAEPSQSPHAATAVCARPAGAACFGAASPRAQPPSRLPPAAGGRPGGRLCARPRGECRAEAGPRLAISTARLVAKECREAGHGPVAEVAYHVRLGGRGSRVDRPPRDDVDVVQERLPVAQLGREGLHAGLEVVRPLAQKRILHREMLQPLEQRLSGQPACVMDTRLGVGGADTAPCRC